MAKLYYGLFGAPVVPVAGAVLFGCAPAGLVVELPAPGVTVVGDVVVVVVVPGLVTLGVVTVDCTLGVVVIVPLVVPGLP